MKKIKLLLVIGICLSVIACGNSMLSPELRPEGSNLGKPESSSDGGVFGSVKIFTISMPVSDYFTELTTETNVAVKKRAETLGAIAGISSFSEDFIANIKTSLMVTEPDKSSYPAVLEFSSEGDMIAYREKHNEYVQAINEDTTVKTDFYILYSPKYGFFELLTNNADINNDMVLSKDGKTLFAYYGKASSVVIPLGVEKIGSGAFAWNKSIKTVTLPASVTELGDFAFAHSSISEVSSEGSIKEGSDVFKGCENAKRNWQGQ